ncbi:MAG: DUF501 domain-containing protein [Actinomycetota bacterium]|nr:DUF501 domain-containing protein [Actinomycetota bacterium]
MRVTTMEKDFKVVGNQLGRRPRDLLAVVKRCYKNRPKVIATSPILEDGSPFPTVFWLTCPVLVKKVALATGTNPVGELIHEKIGEDNPACGGECEVS